MTRLLIAAALAALTTSATAATSPAIWEDQTYEETGKYGKPELVDDALGSWCYARGSRLNTRDTMVFERAQQCRTLEVVVGRRGYRALGSSVAARDCSLLEMGHAEYFKNVVVRYKCSDDRQQWVEEVELGFSSSNQLLMKRLGGAR